MAASLFCFAALAGEDYTMASGRVLKNAYVMERKPNGVTVGHATGVMFVKYDQMSPELRKQLGYDEKKCAAYETAQGKAKAARKKQQADKAAADAKFRKELHSRQEKYRITELEDKIRATEVRIERLKMEIPKLEADSKDYLSKAVSLAGDDDGGSSRTFTRGGVWGSSSTSNRAANRQATKKRFKAAKAVGEEYSSTKFRLRSYKDELERKTLQLEQMKRQLAQMKKEQSSKGDKKGGFLSNLF
jgi:DNA repair exonuclease SbcCD ATPase subunit